MHLIVGLGNPGKKYSGSRHNLGFLVVDRLAEKRSIRVQSAKFSSLYGRGSIEGCSVVLVKPQTFMNLSGESVTKWVHYFDLALHEVLIVHDDLDLETGRIKLVRSGGPGGHKGMDSIIRMLGSRELPRLKLGIGRPRFHEPVEEYVLRGFYGDEESAVEESLRNAVPAVESWVIHGPDRTMNQVNQHQLTRR